MSASDTPFAEGWKDTPYWWEQTPPVAPHDDLPGDVDVLIVGSGYTGLHAAIQTARAGLSTVVLEAGVLGAGCSTRNGGQISTSIKPSADRLARAHGAEAGEAIRDAGRASLEFVQRFVGDEGIDCDLRSCGRFHGAHHPRTFERLKTRAEGSDAIVVQPDAQQQEIGSAAYFGGVIYPDHASLDPGKYHAGLVARARSAGVGFVSHCKVTHLAREGSAFQVRSACGETKAQQVVLATNGYSDALSPWHRRRVIPIGSYIIATDILPKALIDKLAPTDRIFSDTRRLVYYYRASPDRRRILFGGRVSLAETDAQRSGEALYREMVRIFPELAAYQISHSWSGSVGYTFDTLAHAGADRGLHYAMGYCGSGVGMASFLGARIGRLAAGQQDARTIFHDLPFPTRPLYHGNPWFLAPSVAAYRVLDRFGW